MLRSQLLNVALRLPLWFLAAVFSAYPFVSIAGWIRTRRRRLRLPICHRCSYNLTGNVSGVCPECGTAVHRHKEPTGDAFDAPQHESPS